MKRSVLVIIFSFCAIAAFSQQFSAGSVEDRNAVFAREEFRRGLQAYNRFSFNEAILSLEKALSYKPNESVILEWLGRAYYRTGLEDTAIHQWQAAQSSYDPSSPPALLLNGWIDTIRNRRSLYPELADKARYVAAGRYPGKNSEVVFYRQPTSVLPLPDATSWVVAYGSNEIVQIDVNGLIRQRLRGPLQGFDRPYDIARGLDGRLYVSEFKGNRISVLDGNGAWKSYIGSKGRGDGQFVGPQNLCIDDEGYLYVVDYGNLRVEKFDPDGTFLLSFATRSDAFEGLKSPTGIAARKGQVFVADAGTGRILRFDNSGNYQGVLAEDAFIYPESLRFEARGRLLVADTRQIALVDPETGSVQELGGIGKAGGRIVCADVDRNGNLILANFDLGEVDLMAQLEDLAAGLFVQIDRVISDKFPQMTVELRVQDRNRRPVVGLGEHNFHLTEKGNPVNLQRLEGAGDNGRAVDLSILIERSPAMQGFAEDLGIAARDLASSADSIVSVISAGEQPVKEKAGSGRQVIVSAKAPSVRADPRWKFDLALRLAATDLLDRQKRRAVFFLSTGSLGEKAFERYSLSELASYLANNGITFSVGLLGEAAPADELKYLCEQTGGEIVRVYQNEGVKPAVERLRTVPLGSYTLTYTSALPTNFGKAFLPVETEVQLLERSGRDAVSYFPPLE